MTAKQPHPHSLPTAPGRSGELRRLGCLLMALVLLVIGLPAPAQDNVRLPDMGGTGQVLPPDQERAFPRDFRLYMRQERLLIEDAIVSAYFQDMGYRLVMHSDNRDRDFHFHVLRIPGINAFAAPAGVIALNAGLILAADGPDEVAGVVAHEIAHVTQNHLQRGMEAQQAMSFPMLLATMGLVLAGSLAGGMDAETAQGVLATGVGLAQQSQINFTRQNESEADRIGIQLMARAGYDPGGMAAFFSTLNRASRSMGAGPPEYLRTHPLTVSRVAEARDRAERLTVRRPIEDDRFHLVQARLRVLMARQPDEAIEYFRGRLARDEGTEAGNRYGLALALIDASRHAEAEDQLTWLLERSPDHQLYRLLEADLLMARQRIEQALEAYGRLYAAYGHSQIVAVPYARALLRAGSPEMAGRAAEILATELRRRPEDLDVSELLAYAADRSGDPVRAAEVVAENYYQRGGLTQAIEQLERILDRDTLDYYQRARITARLDQLRGEQARRLR
ncbi:M48 family metallopeptidase [Wenzhouxiangella sp. XN79A]|uniref:M48 family metalloprotease n=1 Tax=Wenzhouxiangella sp. XN79A TaxID=2724193 RepID=UPI00144A8A83|nr:M48 family metalloprotease [Wenzhouxiangella sp. XN79A]NKI35931.1 M48 family metallopeptidase [Wenzhouxiangella sp. XN79A]